MIVVQSGRSRTSRSSPGTDHVYEFPTSETSCSIRTSSSPVLPSGHGSSRIRRSVLPNRCLSSLAWNWNVAKDDKHLFGNTDLRILEEPWPDDSTGELMVRMEQDVSL